jgi:hypothetical protein
MPTTTSGLTSVPFGRVTYGGPRREQPIPGDAPAPPLPLLPREPGQRSLMVASLILALEALRAEPDVLAPHKVRSAA